jgi:prophage tail gpP-like protein
MVNGVSYDDWFEVDLDSDIFTIADTWHVRARAPEPEIVTAFREGMIVDVYVGDDRQMAGVIDDVELSGNRTEDVLELNGRDKAAFLTDSEAPQIRGVRYTLKQLAQKLLKPSWGVRSVIVSNANNRKLLMGKKDRKKPAGRGTRGALPFADPARQSVTVPPDARVAQILDHRTQQLGIAWWMTAGGDLFIGRPEYNQEVAYRFVVKPGRSNVESWRVVRSMADRYSEVVVNGQGASSSGLFTPRAKAKGAKFSASVVDPDLKARGIERRLVITDSDVQNHDQALRRAESEMGHRRLSGLTITLTAPGFAQEDRLFAIDTLAYVTIERAKIDGIFYVTARRFQESRAKRRTVLTLHETRVWLA